MLKNSTACSFCMMRDEGYDPYRKKLFNFDLPPLTRLAASDHSASGSFLVRTPCVCIHSALTAVDICAFVWARWLSRYSDSATGWTVRDQILVGTRSYAPGPGAHPASCKMGTGSFPGVKCGQGVALNTHHLLVPRSWKSRAIPLPTLWATPGPITGTLYLIRVFSLAVLLVCMGRCRTSTGRLETTCFVKFVQELRLTATEVYSYTVR